MMQTLVQQLFPLRMQNAIATCSNPGCGRRDWMGHFASGRASLWLNGKWFCSTACVRPGLIVLARARTSARDLHRHRLPLGLLLLSRGQISSTQLQRALDIQRLHAERRIGECLVAMRAVQEFDITAAVAAQWGCPVFSSPASPVSATIPFGLMERYGMVPDALGSKRQLLHLGFCREVDYVAMAAAGKKSSSAALRHASSQILFTPNSCCGVPRPERRRSQGSPPTLEQNPSQTSFWTMWTRPASRRSAWPRRRTPYGLVSAKRRWIFCSEGSLVPGGGLEPPQPC